MGTTIDSTKNKLGDIKNNISTLPKHTNKFLNVVEILPDTADLAVTIKKYYKIWFK